MRGPPCALRRTVNTIGHSKSLDLLLDPLRLLHWVVHLRSNPLLQLLIVHSLDTLFAIHAGFLRGADNAHGYYDADIADAGDFWIEPTLRGFVGKEGVGEGGGGGVDHGLGYCCCLGEDGAETDAGEDVHVVAWRRPLVCIVGYYWSRKTFLSKKGLRTLSWGQYFAVVLEVIEGTTAGEEAFSVGILDGVFECAFGFG